eukprot:gene18498-20351_t
MSLATLKRRLSLYDLKRNKKDIDLSDVEGMIRHELDGPGCISGSRHDTVAGKPDELYFLPEKFGAANQLHLVLQDKIEEAKLRCTSSEATNDYQNYFNHVLSQLGREKPNHWKEALELNNYLLEHA